MYRVNISRSGIRPSAILSAGGDSRRNTDRFPKRTPKGGPGNAPPWNFLDFYVIQPVFGQFHSPRMEPCKSADYFISQFQLGKYFIVIKNIFIVKNLTNFRKTVETGVDPRLKWAALLCWSRTGLNHRVCLLNFRTSGTWLRLNTSFQTNHVLNMFKEVFSQLLILKSTKTNKYTVKGIYLKGLRNTETNFNILCTMLFWS